MDIGIPYIFESAGLIRIAKCSKRIYNLFVKARIANRRSHRWIEEWFEDVRTAIRKRSETLDVTPEDLEEYIKPARGADSPNG